MSTGRSSSLRVKTTRTSFPHSYSHDSSRRFREELEYERLTYGQDEQQVQEVATTEEEGSGSGQRLAGNNGPEEDGGIPSGSSSFDDPDDPEYLELVERENIIAKYDQGPDHANIDPWENPNFDLYQKMDRWGFVHKEGTKSDEDKKRRVDREIRREKKWLNMLKEWKKGGAAKKMNERIWKGIPSKLRMIVWPELLHISEHKAQTRRANTYSELLLRARLVSRDIKQIDLDINRTYRDHLAFRRRYDVKQQSLLNVLAAYSMYNTEVGYCQGMSQIAALFLMFLDEEDAFWCLHSLMVSKKHMMHGFFVPGFPKLMRFEAHFKKLFKKYKPKLYKHLDKEGIPFIFLTKWWFGCFLDRVPFSLALRLWDVFILEGDVILLAMSLNIMRMHEKTIKKLHMETFMEFIQSDIATDFGYSDDETMFALHETLDRLRSDHLEAPPPPENGSLPETPTKAFGPVLSRSMADIRSDIAEIQSRCSRANSMAGIRSPPRASASRPPPSPSLPSRQAHTSNRTSFYENLNGHSYRMKDDVTGKMVSVIRDSYDGDEQSESQETPAISREPSGISRDVHGSNKDGPSRDGPSRDGPNHNPVGLPPTGHRRYSNVRIAHAANNVTYVMIDEKQTVV